MEIIRLNTKKKRELSEILKPFGKNYARFSRSPASYKYVRAIGINVCPYCNMNYVFTIESHGRARATLDHFLSKINHPNRIMDPDNLIPSCSVCNSSLKGKKLVSRRTHLHPFHDDFNSLVQISVDIKNIDIYRDSEALSAVFNIITNEKSERLKVRNTIMLFCLEERYALVGDVIKEIILLARTWSEHRATEDIMLVSGEQAPGKYLDALLHHIIHSSINHTSLSKLRKDVLLQLLK